MKLSLRWLADYVDIDLAPRDLAERLTMAGTEVGGLHPVGGSWEGVFVGELVGIEPHPNADRLRLATVDLGHGRQHKVVCGAPNLTLGDRIAFATVGARLRNGHTGEEMVLTPAKIRGVESAGMVCSERELGLSEEHEGILVLPADAPLGVPLATYMGDTIFDLELTRNRPDCYAVIGIAREVAALTNKRVREPETAWTEAETAVTDLATVEIRDPDLCYRYCSTVLLDVTVGPSPDWMQQRLLAAGMRPINNVVDVTNYVMLEYGQPLHAFDYDKLSGHSIIVRRAGADRSLTTLDGVQRPLLPETLVICDADGPIALAGVMGGGNSEVSETTRRVLIESASFNNISVRRTQRRLRMSTEASQRFEKGISPEMPMVALKRATALMSELCGAPVARGIIDVYPTPHESPTIRFGTAHVRRVLGADIPADTIRSVFESLGFRCGATGMSGEEFDVTPPYWRMDIKLVEDLVEEVARVVGYDTIPETVLAEELPTEQLDSRELKLRERIKDVLAGLGMQEVLSYPLISLSAIERAQPSEPGHAIGDPIRLFNPMSEDMAYLRTTLRPSLLLTLAANQRQTQDPIRLFELGMVYLKRGARELPEQKYILGMILAGPRVATSWHDAQPPATDFYDARAILDTMFARLTMRPTYEAASAEGFYVPGQVARVSVGKTAVGSIGRVHPSILEAFDIQLPDVFYAGLSVPMMLRELPAQPEYRHLTRFPELVRDLAVVVDEAVPAAAVESILRAGELVRDVRLFDVYRGTAIGAGKKSLAFNLRFQAEDRTLSEAEAEKLQASVLNRLSRELGATLRA